MRHPLLARSPAKSARTRKPHRLDTYGPGRSVPPLHVPCRRRGASASPSARSAAHARVGTRRCPSQCSGTIGAHTGTTLGLTLVAVLAGVRARHQREMASQDSRERPVPAPHAPPPSQHVAHTAHTPAPHIADLRFGHRRVGRTVRPRGRRATRWKWIWRRRCGRTPTPLRGPLPRPRRSLACSAHSGA